MNIKSGGKRENVGINYFHGYWSSGQLNSSPGKQDLTIDCKHRRTNKWKLKFKLIVPNMCVRECLYFSKQKVYFHCLGLLLPWAVLTVRFVQLFFHWILIANKDRCFLFRFFFVSEKQGKAQVFFLRLDSWAWMGVGSATLENFIDPLRVHYWNAN